MRNIIVKTYRLNAKFKCDLQKKQDDAIQKNGNALNFEPFPTQILCTGTNCAVELNSLSGDCTQMSNASVLFELISLLCIWNL